MVYYSWACAIADPDTDTVVVTGGLNTHTTVTVYSVQGWKENLPSLNTGRDLHACTSYMTGGKRVSNFVCTICFYLSIGQGQKKPLSLLFAVCIDLKLRFCRFSLLAEAGLEPLSVESPSCWTPLRYLTRALEAGVLGRRCPVPDTA